MTAQILPFNRPKPIPEHLSCSFMVGSQWFTTLPEAIHQLATEEEQYTNAQLVEVLIAAGFRATRHGNFIHLTPPNWY